MNLLEWIKKKFKKKNYDIKMMKFGDNIVIPGRNYFKDPKKIIILEEYKKHYLKQLNRRSVISTLSFNSNKLKQDINMNVDLIVRILMDNDDFYNYAYEELMIQSAKLKMYKEEIDALEEETILRLVALKEIEMNEQIPRRNIMALKEEINQLEVILDMYSFKKTAICVEIENYEETVKVKAETECIMNKINNRESIESYDEVFKQRLDNLIFISDGIYDIKKLDNCEYIKLKIAILERECEKYAYLNKNEVATLKKELEKLSLTYGLDDSEKEKLIAKCTKLEKKLLLFYYYSKYAQDLITENDLRKFYEFKFQLLTSNIYSLEKSPINKNDKGLPYYKKIIEDRLNIIKYNYSHSDNLEKLNNLIKYLKNNNEYDFEEILLNKYKLSFLLSFGFSTQNDDDIREFFNKTYISINKETLNEFGREGAKIPGIVWSDIFPLASYFELLSDDVNHPLYYFYKNCVKERDNLLVPEGVKSIYFSEYPVFIKLKEKVNSTNIVKCPKSLESISGYIEFEEPKDLILNDGLEVIDSCDFTNIGVLTIPSTVKYFLHPAFIHFKKIETIVFEDFEKSKVINDKEVFLEFIRRITEEINTGEVRNKRNYYVRNYKGFFDYVSTAHVYKIVPVPSEIIFKSRNLGNVVIKSSVLTIYYENPDGAFYSFKSAKYDEIYEEIRKAILKKTNFDINYKEKDNQYTLRKKLL